MPTTPIAPAPLRVPILLAAAGLALAATAAWGQGDPLGEPFPAVLELAALDGEIGFTLNGVRANDFSGRSVASAGDLNGDGIDDLVIGARHAEPLGRSRAGASYVVFGRDAASSFPATLDLADLDGTNGFRLDGADAADNSGWSVAAAGDVNGDGIDDLVIGAWGANSGGRYNSGASYVVFGRDATSPFPATLELADLDGTNGFTLLGVAMEDRSGWSVAAAGDVNGDGVDDLVIGARFADYLGRSNTGASYVVFGRGPASPFPATLELAELDGINGFTLHGVIRDELSGDSVAGAGDVNGDGIDDLVIGAPYANPGGRATTGASYVVFGRGAASPFPDALELADLDGTNGFTLQGVDRNDSTGQSVATAGDVNGDGVDDVIIGARAAGPGGRFSAGASYVVYGHGLASPFPDVLDLASLDGTSGFRIDGVDSRDQSGRSVASAGDVNGDGANDLIIGAWAATPGGRMVAGASYVVFGRDAASPFPAVLELASLDGTIGFTLNGVRAGDHSGQSVASAGDINGDGADDLVIGAYRAHPGGRPDAGESYVVFGRQPAAPCRADLDGDGELTLFDFLAFQNLFDAMDPIADFDGDGDFTIFDFLAFQNAFDAGCP